MYGGLTISVSNSTQSACKSKQSLKSTKPRAKKQVSPLRQSMICDMELAGYTQVTRPGKPLIYLEAVATDQLNSDLDYKAIRKGRLVRTYPVFPYSR